jgi:hypothetical protein
MVPATEKKLKPEGTIAKRKHTTHGRNYSSMNPNGLINIIDDENIMQKMQVNEDSYATNIAGSSMIHSLLLSPQQRNGKHSKVNNY